MRESFEEEKMEGMGEEGTASERVRKYFARKLEDVTFPVTEEAKEEFVKILQAAVGDFYEDYRAKLVGVTEYREYIEELKKDENNKGFVEKVEKSNALEIRTKEQIKKLATSVELNVEKDVFINKIIKDVIANCQPFPVRDIVDALSITYDTSGEIKEESPEQRRLVEDNWLEYGKLAPIFLAIHPILFSFPALSPGFWKILKEIEANCSNQNDLDRYLEGDEFIKAAMKVARKELEYAKAFATGDWGQVIKEKSLLPKAQKNIETLSNLQEEIEKIPQDNIDENIIEQKRQAIKQAIKSVREKFGEIKIEETAKQKNVREQNERRKNNPIDLHTMTSIDPSKKTKEKFSLKNLFKKKDKKQDPESKPLLGSDEIDIEVDKESFFSKARKNIGKKFDNVKSKVKGIFKKKEKPNPLEKEIIELPPEEPKKNSTSNPPVESNIDIEDDEKPTWSKKLRKVKSTITDFIKSEDSAGDEAFAKKLPSMNKAQLDKEIERQNTLVGKYNDQLISSSPSQTGGLIKLLLILIGAAIGFAVGGPLGAVLGAGLGYLSGQSIENTVAPAFEKRQANADLKRAEKRIEALEERRKTLIEKEKTESKEDKQDDRAQNRNSGNFVENLKAKKLNRTPQNEK